MAWHGMVQRIKRAACVLAQTRRSHAVLAALDDNELRKRRDVARRCDAAAIDFVARFYRAAPAETRAAVAVAGCGT